MPSLLKEQKRGKTPVHLRDCENYRSIIRHIDMLEKIDRFNLSSMLNIPYGVAACPISELFNEGYLDKTKEKRCYRKEDVEANVDMRVPRRGHAETVVSWPYSKAKITRQSVYVKSQRWPEFLKRWSHFIKTGHDPDKKTEVVSTVTLKIPKACIKAV